MAEIPAGWSFPIHGGTCRVITDPKGGLPVAEDPPPGSITVDGDYPESGFVHLSQSLARHLHTLHWLIAAGAVSLAVVMVLTDWQYVSGTGQPVGWPVILAIGLYLPAVRLGQLVWARRKGYTWASEIPLEDIERVELTTAEVRWYLKRTKTVPQFAIVYRSDGGERRRRVRCELRHDAGDVREAVRAFEKAGLRVDVTEAARETLAEA